MKVDYAIITIREDEFKAVLRRFETVRKRMPQGRTYRVGYITSQDKQQYTVAIARCSEQGTDVAQKVANDIIHDLDPQLILVVGIAGVAGHGYYPGSGRPWPTDVASWPP